MKMNKKLLLGLGSIPIVALPVATIVSCGGGGEQLSNPQNQGDEQKPNNPQNPGDEQKPNNPQNPGDEQKPNNPQNPGDSQDSNNPQNQDDHQPNNPQGPNVENNNTPPEINNTLSNIFDGLVGQQGGFQRAINVLSRDFNKKLKDPNLPKKTKAEVLKIAEDKLNKLTQDEFAKLLNLTIMKTALYSIIEHANIREDSLELSYAKDIVLNEDKTFSFTYVFDGKNKQNGNVYLKEKHIIKFENLKLIPEVYVDKKNNQIFPTFKIGFDENKLPTVKLLNREKWINFDLRINAFQQLVNEAIQQYPEKAEEIKKYFEAFKVEYSKQLEIENNVEKQISGEVIKLSSEGKLGIDPNTNKFSIDYYYGNKNINGVWPMFDYNSKIGYEVEKDNTSGTPVYKGVVSAPLVIYSPIFFGTFDEKNKVADWEVYLEQPEQPSTPLVQTQ